MKNKGRQRVIEGARKKHPDGWSAQLCYWCGHERIYHLMPTMSVTHKAIAKNDENFKRYSPISGEMPCFRGSNNNKCGCWRFDTVKEAVAATLAGDAHPHRKVSAGYWREKEAI